jgi:hypothetical protein
LFVTKLKIFEDELNLFTEVNIHRKSQLKV